MATTYWQKLKDPRWQRKRLEALDAAGFACQICYDSTSTLHVHHKQYFKGREPWEYEVKQLAVVCESCHEETHGQDDELAVVCSFLPLDGPFSRVEMAAVVAGYAEQDLPPSQDHLGYLTGLIASKCFGHFATNIDDLLCIARAAESNPIALYEAILAAAKVRE